MCYLLTPGPLPDVGTKYTLSSDPRSPVFYSTCFRRQTITRVVYQNAVPPSATQIPWRYGDACLSCADQEAFSKVDPAGTTAIGWRVNTTGCERCSD